MQALVFLPWRQSIGSFGAFIQALTLALPFQKGGELLGFRTPFTPRPIAVCSLMRSTLGITYTLHTDMRIRLPDMQRQCLLAVSDKLMARPVQSKLSRRPGVRAHR